MLFVPKLLGNRSLDSKTLESDRKSCQKIGPCGIGKEAVYLNSFFIDRTYYVTYTDVRRVFKRVAMSRGGFSGKGLFGSMPYLVVQLSNGQEKQCNFKYEEDVDRFLRTIEREHPEIPIHSKEAEERLKKAREEEEARYLKTLSPAAEEAVASLQKAKSYLEEKPEISDQLSNMAKRRRSVDGIKRSNLAIAITIFALSLASLAFGIFSFLSGNRDTSVYFVLFGFAFLFFVAAAGVLPTARNNRRSVKRDWDEAVSQAEAYIGSYGDGRFPVPAQYAHPVVLGRMIRILREGRAETTADAFDCMKKELKDLNHTKTVSQQEYDEVITVKPMFLVMDYE